MRSRTRTVAVSPAAAAWQGSHGPVVAHRVAIGLDAGRLGTVRAAHAACDALCAAVAAAIATRPNEALLDVALVWQRGAPSVTAGYRDAPPPAGDALARALGDYLDGAGEAALAAAVQGAASDPDGRAVTVRGVGLSLDARARATITRAVRDLVGEPRLTVKVVRHDA